MAKCNNCKKDKRHLESTYIQVLKSNRQIIRVLYYCHECIQNHWFVKKEIERKLEDCPEYKILRSIPELNEFLTPESKPLSEDSGLVREGTPLEPNDSRSERE